MKPTACQEAVLSRIRNGHVLAASLTISSNGSYIGCGRWKWRGDPGQRVPKEKAVSYSTITSLLSKGLIQLRDERYMAYGIELARRVVEIKE